MVSSAVFKFGYSEYSDYWFEKTTQTIKFLKGNFIEKKKERKVQKKLYKFSYNSLDLSERECPENKFLWNFEYFFLFSFVEMFQFSFNFESSERLFFRRILGLNFFFQLILIESFKFSFNINWVFCKVIFSAEFSSWIFFNFVEFWWSVIVYFSFISLEASCLLEYLSAIQEASDETFLLAIFFFFFSVLVVWFPSSYWEPNSSFRQIVGGSFLELIFANVSHQTRLDARPKARRPYAGLWLELDSKL